MSEVQKVSDLESPEFQTQIKSSLLELAQNISKAAGNGRPVSHNQILNYLNILQNMAPIKRGLAEEVREWVMTTGGNFLTTDVYRELNLTTRDHKKAVCMALLRLEKENLLAKCGEKRGCYRIIEACHKPMDWENCDVTKTFDLNLPLGLHKLMYLYPKNIIVIAGDTNAGKTAYLLNVVRENADRMPIDYFTNDLTPEELKKRVQRFNEAGMNTENFSKCQFIPRVKDFLDVLNPDRVTIIDYLQLTDDFWKVAGTLDEIYNKLESGICIVAIQKKKGMKLGRGGDFAMERPRLYFTLEEGKLIIQKMKNLIDAERNPNGKYVRFNLWGGCKFIPKGGWSGGPRPDPEAGQGDDSQPF